LGGDNNPQPFLSKSKKDIGRGTGFTTSARLLVTLGLATAMWALHHKLIFNIKRKQSIPVLLLEKAFSFQSKCEHRKIGAETILAMQHIIMVRNTNSVLGIIKELHEYYHEVGLPKDLDLQENRYQQDSANKKDFKKDGRKVNI